MEAVDKVDSGNLTIDEVLYPQGWILAGFLMDPRTGLGRRLSPYGPRFLCYLGGMQDFLHMKSPQFWKSSSFLQKTRKPQKKIKITVAK